MFSRKLTRVVAAGAAILAVAIGGFAIGNSSSSNDASGTAYAAQRHAPGQMPRSTPYPPQAAAPGGAPQSGQVPQEGQVPQDWSPGTGTIITGAAADQAEAAALAANYPGTVNRVVLLSDGSYAVHMFATSGPHHVFVSKDFKVTGAQ